MSESDEKGLTQHVPTKLPATIEMNKDGMVLKTIEDLWRLSTGIHASGMAPKSLNTKDKVAVAILTGAEAGLSPMAAVRSVYVVNGAPAWISRAARALVVNSGLLKPGTKIEEGVKHGPDCTMGAGQRCGDACFGYCRTWRNGDHESREHTFSVADAKRANLWKKPGPWQEYHQRMLMHRAAGFHFDDCWSDILMGLPTVDVLRDYPQAAFVREGEVLVTDATPPGRDPLLGPASGAAIDIKEGAGEGTLGEVVDAVSVPTAPASEELDAPEAPAPSEINLGAYRETPTASEKAAGIDPMQEDGAGNGPKGEEVLRNTSDEEQPSPAAEGSDTPAAPAPSDPMDDPLPPRYVADEEEPAPKPSTKKKKKPAPKEAPVADQQAPFIANCSVNGCGREFDPDREPHWNREGVFRCSECGPFPK